MPQAVRGSDTKNKRSSREINQIHVLQTPFPSAPGASLRRCLQLLPSVSGGCGPPDTPPSQPPFEGTGTTNLSLLDAGGRGDGGGRNGGEKSPAFTSQRNFWDSSIMQPGDQVTTTEHLSSRLGAHRQMVDFGEWERGRRIGLCLCFPPQFF